MNICMAVVSDMKYDARVFKEAKSLVDRGYKVNIISFTPESKEKSWTQEGVEIVAIPFIFAKPKSLKDKLIKLYTNTAFFFKFFNLIMSVNADVYHAHNTNTLMFVFIASRIKRKKLIYDSHELFRDLFPARKYTLGWVKQALERWVEQSFITKADGVITVSESYADKLSEYYPIARPTVLQNCPHLTEQLKGVTKQDYGILDDEVVVLYQGGYYLDTRAIDKLIMAMKYLPDSYKLIMIGFAVRDEETILRNLVKEQRLGDKVIFLPPVPHQELAKYTAIADVGTIPFYDNCLAMHLCTPNKVYEYLNAGIPIVSTDMPELKKIFVQHQVGEVFDPHSPESITEAILAVTKNTEELKSMKFRSRAAAETEYNWQVEEKKLIALYQSIMEG